MGGVACDWTGGGASGREVKGRGLWEAWLLKRRGRGLEIEANWGGVKKRGGVACGDEGRGLRVRGKGVCGGVASAVKGAWPREG